MYQESELVDLLLVALLTPLLWAGLRSVTVAGKGWFIASYAAIAAGFVFTVAEGYAAPDLLNVLEHAGYALSGVLLAVACFIFMRDARAKSSPA